MIAKYAPTVMKQSTRTLNSREMIVNNDIHNMLRVIDLFHSLCKTELYTAFILSYPILCLLYPVLLSIVSIPTDG